MSWNGTTKRMVAPVGWGDISQATGVGGQSYDLGDMLKNSVIINKWAKWKPVRDSAKDLPTRESRKTSGRTVHNINRQYGVQASGFGLDVPLSAIHSCAFTYEPPQVAAWRAGDFIDPEDPRNHGYNGNAHLDFYGKIWLVPGQARPIIESDGLLLNDLELQYSPHSAADAAEMMSIQDFLWNESQATQPLDPDDMYPCILISQGDFHYIHCLHPDEGQHVLTKLGDGTGHWGCPPVPVGGSDGLAVGYEATVSLFLCSGRYLLGPNTGTDISTWVRITGDRDIWAVWFCPVPDACGQMVDVGTSPSSDPQIIITSIRYNDDHTLLWVDFNFINPVSSSEYEINVSCDSAVTVTRTIIMRPQATGGSQMYSIPSGFPNAFFTPGRTNVFDAWITKNGVPYGTGEMSAELTY